MGNSAQFLQERPDLPAEFTSHALFPFLIRAIRNTISAMEQGRAMMSVKCTHRALQTTLCMLARYTLVERHNIIKLVLCCKRYYSNEQQNVCDRRSTRFEVLAPIPRTHMKRNESETWSICFILWMDCWVFWNLFTHSWFQACELPK
jgi:hypothetical protein